MTISIKQAAYLLSFFIVTSGCARKTDPSVFNKLKKLLDQKEFFKLRADVQQYDKEMDDRDQLYFKAYLSNAFNHNEDCVTGVDSLLKKYPDTFPDSVKIALARLQSDGYFKLYQYAKAADADDMVIKRYGKTLSKDDLEEFKNYSIIRNGLRNTPPQTTKKTGSTTIPWKRDRLNLINIPVKTNHVTFDGIFDTRANISTVTQTYAKKMGLHILDVSYTEGSGATGITFKSGMGIADSLFIGDILIKNVVFQVMPDSILYIGQLKFQINLIIGYPVIGQLEEIHVYKDGRMTIPETPAESGLHNLALDKLDPVIDLQIGNDHLPFHFDSGAAQTGFYQAYFDRYKADILKTGFKKTIGVGGAGGMQKKEVFILPKLKLTLADKPFFIDSISVLTKKITPDEKLYGNVGQDLVNQFNEFVYNFKYMYVKGE